MTAAEHRYQYLVNDFGLANDDLGELIKNLLMSVFQQLNRILRNLSIGIFSHTLSPTGPVVFLIRILFYAVPIRNTLAGRENF